MMSLPLDQASLHGLVEDRAGELPEKAALVSDGQVMTYAELNQTANKIAHYLREVTGVRPDDPVAIMVRQPLASVVAMLAVLKAGGAYVPIDPDSPPALTAALLDHIAPRVVLLESSAAAKATFFEGEIFVIDVMTRALDTSGANPRPAAGPDQLAYIMHTSGTTGTPKGVAVEHRAIVNTVSWRIGYYKFGPADVALSVSRHTFDSSVEDIFCMLACGGTVLLADRDRVTDRRYLADLIASAGVTHFIMTPALYRRLIGGLDVSTAPALRVVTIAGEWFTADLVREHYERLPGVELVNEYGPAENAVCSTVHPLAASDEAVLIGRPIDQVLAFVVTDHGGQAVPGETGELYLAGAGLAREYYRNPELTAEKFARWQAPDGQALRVYRTGDFVQVHEGGDLQFLGRQDRQVKIRGRRVELDHIAARLLADPQVSDGHVLHFTAEKGTPYLVAFIVSPAPDPERLLAAARDSLPDYMVPSAIIPVDEIPITRRTGKVDEEALLAIYQQFMAGGQPEQAASSVYELALLSLWQRMFPPLTVGLDHDFFDLGGDSLLAMELVAGIEEIFGIQLETSDVYEARSVRNLALLVDRSRAGVAEGA